MDRDCGGLGVRNLEAFNLALLGQWVWRICFRVGFWWHDMEAWGGLRGLRVGTHQSGGGTLASCIGLVAICRTIGCKTILVGGWVKGKRLSSGKIGGWGRRG